MTAEIVQRFALKTYPRRSRMISKTLSGWGGSRIPEIVLTQLFKGIEII